MNIVKSYIAFSSFSGMMLFNLGLPEDPSPKDVIISSVSGAIYGVGIVPVLPVIAYILEKDRQLKTKAIEDDTKNYGKYSSRET